MNKTIYVRDEDVPIWDRAKELAGEKLAPVIMDGLRKFIATKELERTGFDRIEVRFRDSKANDLPTAKAFIGRWILSREEPLCIPHGDEFEETLDYTECFAIAQTAKNRLVVFSWIVYGDDATQYEFQVFEDVDELKSHGLHREVVAAVIEKLGVEVEELDI